ncbi:MAG: IPTL-CTERM sorting domain-containing protein [Acidobacteriota bacterium]
MPLALRCLIHDALRRSRSVALPWALVLGLCFGAGAAGAAEYTALLDLDDDASTGCSVITADGPFDGVEVRVITTVPDGMDMVTAVEREDCIDPGTDTFGPRQAVTDIAPPWPVGLGLGIGGSDVVESYLPLGAPCQSIRLGFVGSDDAGGLDALLTTTGTQTGGPIVVACGTIVDIPTLSETSLLLLALVLAALAAWTLRRHRHGAGPAALWIVAALALSSLALGVYAGAGIVLDGDPSDWTDPAASGVDPVTDAPPLADLAAGFATPSSNLSTLFLRFDVQRGVELPTITPIADQSIAEDASTGPLAFTIGDPDTPIDLLDVTATSSDQALIPDGNLVITPPGMDPATDRTITATPLPDQNGGPVTITLSVADGVTTVTETFDITVTPVDDPPTVTAIADQTIAEDGATGPLAFTVADIDTPLPLGVSATSSDQALIPDGNLVIGGAQPNLTITATPVADQNGGPVTVTLTVTDGTTPVVETFTVTVTPVDDPPTITPIPDQVIAEDGATAALPFTVADIDTPLPLGVSATSSDQTLLPDGNLVLGGTQPNLTIQATPAAGESGAATVTVTVTDGTTPVSTMFLVTVTDVADPPTITPIADQTIDEDMSTAALAFTIGDPDTPLGALGVSASSSDQTLIPDGNLVLAGAPAAARTITATPALNQNGGPVTITVTVTDGTTPVSETFDVTVNAVNDPPTITVIADQTIAEDSSTGALAFTVDDVDSPLPLGLTVTSSDQALIPDGNLVVAGVQPNLTLTATPLADQNGGPLTVTLTVTDGALPAVETFTVTVTPVNDPPSVTSPIAYTALGNTLLRVDSADADNHDFALPERVASTVDLVDAFTQAAPSDIDSPAMDLIFQAGSQATVNGGTFEIDDDGDFVYTPPTGFTGLDSVVVNLLDQAGGMAPVTIQFTVSDMIWYVEDTTGPKNPAAGDTGRSTNAFQTLAAAEAAAGAGHTIFVFETDGPLDEGIALQDGQRLFGQRIEDDADFATLLPGLLLEEIADTNARPQIHRTSGAAVTVDASAAGLANVEIRHLDLQSGDDDAIAVTTAGTNLADVLIDENVIGAAGVHGVDLDFGHTTGTSMVELRDNQLASTNNAIDLVKTSTGDVEVRLLANTGITSTTGRGLRVEDTSGGAGTLAVTALLDNVISGATAGDGAFFGAVTFDADPSTVAFDPVNGNDLAIGSSGDGVGGGGFLLSNVSGDLAFDDLVVEADQAGVVVAGSGVFNGGTGTGFRLTTTTNSAIVANAGPALDLDPMTAAVTLQSITSMASPTSGVRLNDIAGSVVINGGLISGSLGSAVLIDQDTVTSALDLTYSGSITNSAGHLIEVDGYPAGTTTFNGLSLSDSGGAADSGLGIRLVDVDGTVNITPSSAPILESDGRGVAIEGDSDGTINLDNVSITSPAGTAIHIVDPGSSLGATIDLDNVDVTQATAGRTVEIAGLVGSVDFDAASALSATGGTGIRVGANGGASTVAFNGPVDLGTGGSRLTANAFTFEANAAGHVTSVADLDIFTNGAQGLVATGSGRLNALSGGSSTVSLDTQNARAVNLTGIEADVNIDSVTCTNSSDCVTLAALAAGSEHRYAAADLTCTGGTCFNVSTAGQIRATGTASTISATGAVGVRIASTTIDSSDVSFRSVSASGAVNGIVLDATGTSGGFNVLGDGSDTLGGNASGGTIANTTGDAVSINDSADFQFANLRVETPTADAFDLDQIRGTASRIANTRVLNVDQANTSSVRINNVARSFGLTVDRSSFEDNDSGQVVFLTELQGAYTSSLTIEDSAFVAHDADAVSIVPSLGGAPGDTGTLNHTFTRNTIRDSDIDGVSVANFSCGGAAVCNYTITDNVVRNLAKLGNFNGGLVNVGYSGLAVSGGSFDAVVSGNAISASDANSIDHRRGINVILEQASGTVPSFAVDIVDNDIDDLGNREAIFVSMRQPVSTSNVRVVNNRLGTGAIGGTTVRNVGGTRDCAFFETRGAASVTMNLLLEDNVIQCDATGSDSTIDVDVRDGSRINLTMRGNDVSTTGTSNADLDAGPFSTSGTICLDMNAANVGADANLFNPVARLEQTAGTFHIEGLGASPANAAAVEAFLDPRNNNDVAAVGGSFTNNGGAGCPEPPP